MTYVMDAQSLRVLLVLWTVCHGQFNLHAVVIVIGEDAVIRYIFNRGSFLQRCLLYVYRQYHKKISRFTRQR